MGGGGLSRILTSMLSLMTRLRKAENYTSVSEERKQYHNPSMSPIPQKLIADYIRGHPIAFDIDSGAPRLWHRGLHSWGSESVAPILRRLRGSGGVAANALLRFSQRKHSF